MSLPFDGSQSCAEVDPELFFPDNTRDRKAVAKAKQVCMACPLFTACLEYAKSTPGLVGIWGGKLFDGAGYVSPVVINRSAA